MTKQPDDALPRTQFWRPFFEAAANIRLNEPYAEEGTSVAADEPSQATIHPDRTVSDEGDLTYGSAPSVGGTPRAPQASSEMGESSGAPVEPHWSSENLSPFNPGPPPAVGSVDNEDSARPQRALPDVQRLRLRDLPPDSPDIAEPQFETINVGKTLGRAPAGDRDTSRADASNVSKQSTEPSFLQMRGSPAPRHHGQAAPPHSALLNKILRKGLASPATASRPGQSTPGAAAAGKIKYPHDLPSNWDGIANLSETTLDAFPSPIKRRANASVAGDDSLYGAAPSTAASSRSALMSSPTAAASRLGDASSSRNALNASTSTLRRYGTSPTPTRSAIAYNRTPAKEAARRTVQNVYDALGDMDSPALELPSALRNPAKTMTFNYYSSSSGAGAGAGSPSEPSTARRGDRTLLSDEAAGAGRDDSYASMPSQPSFMTQPIPFSHHPPYDASSTSLSRHNDDHVPLADFGGGTTANIDALLAGAPGHDAGGANQYAGIVDDDDDHHHGTARSGGGDESFTGEADDLHAQHRLAEPTYTEGFDEGYSRDEDGFGAGGRALRLPGQDGPEDTLFGMPAGRGGAAAGPGGASRRVTYAPQEEDVGEEEDSFEEEARRSGFRLHGMGEMETLHGGELLASGASLLPHALNARCSKLTLSSCPQSPSRRVRWRGGVTELRCACSVSRAACRRV